jgi:tRNA threonylcarbamoyladenosine biosynthesis protein TsaB
MKVLAMHTTGAEGSVALVEITEEKLRAVGHRTLTRRSGAAELVPAIAEMLRDAGWKTADVEGIAVAVGPGSFTGIRTGLATAKGWAAATGTPVVMVSSLAVLASGAEQAMALLDAGRGEFYMGRYAKWGQEKIAEALVNADELEALLLSEDLNRTQEEIVLCEESVAEALRAADRSIVAVAAPDAETVARVATTRLLRGEVAAWELAEGNYLRRPDAQVKLEQSAAKN